MATTSKKHAPIVEYVSPKQLTLCGFEHPFSKELNPSNRWVVLAGAIPWDEICGLYRRCVPVSTTGRPALNPRIVLGSLIIKHLCDLDDRETVDQISENVYMQYFLGYSSFSTEPPFDASLFVEFRKRLGSDTLNAINERIVALRTHFESDSHQDPPSESGASSATDLIAGSAQEGHASSNTNKGRLIMDATACPQDIAYPTDLNLLNDAREKLEELIDKLFDSSLHGQKPRTYRQVARKEYLHTAQMKKRSGKQIRSANRKQLGYVCRNIRSVNFLLDAYESTGLVFPLSASERKYFMVIQELYRQQLQMFKTRTHSIEFRIVSIHQPHVRPIVRGKEHAKVEFGAKIHLSLIDGWSFLDEVSWEAFNEGSHLLGYLEQYRARFGFYPRQVLVDKIYCTRENRKTLGQMGITLIAKPLGRPRTSAVQIHVSPGERNPIEGKFGQAKTGYGMDRIGARLKGTSESWIATIVLVLNLIKLAGVALLCPIIRKNLSFSASVVEHLTSWVYYIMRKINREPSAGFSMVLNTISV